jgi:beta-1,4-N-acetylglucosaminyltransferase
MKICIVSSCGGHLTEVRNFLPAYDKYDYFYVLNDHAMLPGDMEGKTSFIAHSERDLKFFKNLWEAFVIIRRERPDVLLSTGAGPIVPFAIVGRLLFGTKVVFVETITRINRPSLTGRIMYRLSNHFYYQWHELSTFFPRGNYGGPLL